MTAPDPRLGEIEAIEAAAWTIYKAMHPDHAAAGLDQVGGPIRAYCIDIAHAALEAAHPVLLAELRTAREALARVEVEIGWIDAASHDSEPVYAQGKVSARVAANRLRAAVAAADGGGGEDEAHTAWCRGSHEGEEGALREAKAKALEEAADDIDQGVSAGADEPVHPYETSKWLRARAKAVRES